MVPGSGRDGADWPIAKASTLPELHYLQILRRQGTTRLLLPTLVARIPDSIAATAIVVLVRSATGSYSSAGFAAGAFGIGTAVSAPFAGRALDRLGQRRVLPLLAAGFSVALIVLALASGHLGGGVLVALAVVAGLTRPPLEAALRAMWPRNLALVAFAAAHGSVAWAGVLVAIWGAGSLAGGLAYGNRNWRSPVEGRAVACLALSGAMLMVLAAAPDLAILALLIIPLGVPLSPWLGSLSASVQRAVPAASSAEAFAWTFAVITVGMAAGNACGGIIIQATSAQAAFLAAGGLGLAGAAFGALRLMGPRRRPAISGDRRTALLPGRWCAAAQVPSSRANGPLSPCVSLSAAPSAQPSTASRLTRHRPSPSAPVARMCR
jgi:predicted MFS family arabinose efflux permease